MKNAVRDKLSKRLEDRRESLRRERTRIDKIRKKPGSSNHKKKPNKYNKKVNLSTPVNEKKKKRFDYSLRIADERDGLPLKYSRPSTLIVNLCNKIHSLRESKNIELSLLWPAVPAALPAVHSIATFGSYENGDKLGLRSLYYPAKSNSFHVLNHIRIDAKLLYKYAQDWATMKRHEKEKYNACIKSECVHKDMLYLALHNYISGVGDPDGYPSIGETLPTFPVGRIIWGDFTPRVFKGIFKHISKSGYPVEGLGESASAPDAIFGLHPDLSHSEIVKRLTSESLLPGSGRPPDIAIVDLRGRQRVWLGKAWASKAERFLKTLQNETPYSPIGALVILDDPLAFEYLKIHLAGGKKGKKRTGKRRKSPLSPYSSTHECLESKINLENRGDNVPIAHSKLHPKIVDTEVVTIVNEFYGISNRIKNQNQTLGDILRDCAGYLLWAARLPCSQNTLQRVLSEDARSDQELQWQTENYTWHGYSARLLSELEFGSAADELHNIQQLVSKANAFLKGYSDGTPSGKAVIRFVGEVLDVAAGNQNKKRKPRPLVTVSVSSALQVRLMLAELEAHFQIYDDVGNERIQIVRTSELFSNSIPQIARRLIVLGARPLTLAELCAAHELPKRIELIVNAGDAERIIRTIKSILKYDEYRRFHTPLRQLNEEIEGFLKTAKSGFSILSDVIYWRPKPSADDLYSNIYDANAPPPDIELYLDGAPPISVYKSKSVLVYDSSIRPPFKLKIGKEVEAGDHILVFSEEMKNEIEAYMNSAGRFKSEDLVREYHKHVFDRLNKKYPNMSQVKIIAQIKKDIIAESSETDVTESKIRYWINVAREIDASIEDLKSHAPRVRKDYEAFVKAIGIDADIARLYWDFGIKSFRSEKQQEGRRATWLYQRLLVDRDSVTSLLKIPEEVVEHLLIQARMNVFEVIDVKVLK